MTIAEFFEFAFYALLGYSVSVFVISTVKTYNKIKEAEEVRLTKNIWSTLENTESNQIKKGEWDLVIKVANAYNKSNPEKLKAKFESGEYKRPMILNLNGVYTLVAGNTRLCTAAAMGIKPLVFIAKIDKI